MLLISSANISAIIFEFCIIPLIGLVGAFIVAWINTKRKEALAKTDNEMTQKFINIAADVINSCVIATTETYVKSMKEQNSFDAEAQKIAFDKTKTAVLNTLSDEAKKHLNSVYKDFDTYLDTKIEEAVRNNK